MDSAAPHLGLARTIPPTRAKSQMEYLIAQMDERSSNPIGAKSCTKSCLQYRIRTGSFALLNAGRQNTEMKPGQPIFRKILMHSGAWQERKSMSLTST